MSDKPEFPSLPAGTVGMVSIDVLERLGLKDQYAEHIKLLAEIAKAEEKASKERPRAMTVRELLQKLQALDGSSSASSRGWATVRTDKPHASFNVDS